MQHPHWIALWFGVEVAWLAAMWFFVPESQPWLRPEDEVGVGGGPWFRNLALYGYTFYHLPAIFLRGLFCLLAEVALRAFAVRHETFSFQRVRPLGFVVLGLINFFYFSMATLVL